MSDEIVKPSPPLRLPAQDQAPKRERLASRAHLIDRVTMVLVCGVAVGFAVAYRSDVKQTQAVLTNFQSSVYERCLKRQILDTAAHDAVSSNAEFYATLEAIAADAPIRPGLDAKTRALIERQKAAIHKARLDAERAEAASLPGSCETYRPDR